MKKLPASRIAVFLLFLLPLQLVGADGDYPAEIKTLVEQRCMVCHGCYDAPCQLKLDAWAGLQRGASKEQVYDGSRLKPAQLTRLFEDAQTPGEWREKGFYPVLDEADPEQGVVYRMLALKQQHPLPGGEILPDSFDLRLSRDQQCPKPEEFDAFAQKQPLWGMPYAMPGLAAEEHQLLTRWLREGAPGVARPKPSPAEQEAVHRWEAFFNGDSPKQRLMSRYIYEHLFIGDLYFSDLPGTPRFYNLVRSRTPPGEPVDIIATRRPYDPPGSKSFFYRLQPLRTSLLDKRHMAYALNPARMARWRELFLEPDYTVSKLPDYNETDSANPFVTFRELPVAARYQFMLDEAQFTIMGFIKGPVCRGQVALNVIDDHFWVVFFDPRATDPEQNAEFLARESGNMRMPAGSGSLLVSLVEWRQYAKGQRKYLKAKSRAIAEATVEQETPLDLRLIWDGDGDNDNASLTVFRHSDSASVVKGLVGQTPKTAWVIGFSLLERIHYLLVAGFDVYGNVAHQLETRLYMDFLRMEGEYNFLVFMPEDKRLELRNFWYREADPNVKAYVLGRKAYITSDTAIEYKTDDPMAEFFQLLAPQLPGSAATPYQPADTHFDRLQRLTGRTFSLMPPVSFVNVFDQHGRDSVYTIIHNAVYLNNTQLFQEEKRRVWVEDYLTVVKGFIGAYPNVFFQLPESQLPAFVAAIESLEDESDYAQLLSLYGVRRTDPWFWKLSDRFYHHYRQLRPIEAGLFDLNRYENR